MKTNVMKYAVCHIWNWCIFLFCNSSLANEIWCVTSKEMIMKLFFFYNSVNLFFIMWCRSNFLKSIENKCISSLLDNAFVRNKALSFPEHVILYKDAHIFLENTTGLCSLTTCWLYTGSYNRKDSLFTEWHHREKNKK